MEDRASDRLPTSLLETAALLDKGWVESRWSIEMPGWRIERIGKIVEIERVISGAVTEYRHEFYKGATIKEAADRVRVALAAEKQRRRR